ncbi:MAG: hypothetical protein JWN04_5958, partial [Myxococcaceae bacterium]|nr:hypothetical protein [Myxococcaceae bacterium]
MQVREALVTVLGVSCIASAGLLAMSPRRSTEILGMPSSRALGRTLAVRDAAIGLVLLRRSSRAHGLVLRQVSDAFDAGLALAAMARGRGRSASRLTFAGALVL